MDPNSKCFVMLSHNIKNVDAKVLTGDWYLSEKHDGIRAIWDGSKLLTRSKREFSFVPDWFIKLLPEYPLEGEIIVPGKPFSYFSGVTIRKTDDPRWEEIVFMIFDIPLANLTFHDRFEKIKEFVIQSKSKYISHVKCTLIRNIEKPENMKKIHDKFNDVVGKGREGVMIIRSDNLYEPKRVKTILKYKKENEGECIVIGYLEGKGKYGGMLGKLRCKLQNGSEFNIGGGFVDLQRKCYVFKENEFGVNSRICVLTQPNELWGPVPKIGDIVTYQCMEIIPKTGIPRMPIYKGIRYDL
jgi:DNA ligase-1